MLVVGRSVRAGYSRIFRAQWGIVEYSRVLWSRMGGYSMVLWGTVGYCGVQWAVQ